MKKRIALVGFGYWGPNLLRNLFDFPGCEVLYCCDIRKDRLREVKRRYPGVKTTADFEEVVCDPKVQAVVISTPTKSHYSLARRAIEKGKDVLIEKPMTMNVKEARSLVSLAKKKKRVVMVDHTFLFNDAVHKIKRLIDSGELGDILYIDSVRANLGLFQSDVNVIFDLASHDFSIIQYLLEEKPRYISAHGGSHFNKQEDVAYILAEYPRGIFAHVHVSWLSPLKVRRMLIIGTRKMVVYDDTEQAEKIRVYDKGVIFEDQLTREAEQIKIGYRSGDVWLPKIDIVEPLALLVKEFMAGIESGKPALSDGVFGRDVVEILDAATSSIRTGRKIKLRNADK